jgi:dihydroneopterin aldolase
VDRIVIPGIPLQVRVGVTEEERGAPQEVVIGLVLHLDLAAAGASDDLADTVDYDSVCETVAETVATGPFQLIERIAARVSKAVLEDFGVARVDVRVEKPGAIRGRDVAYAAVEISRERDG